ncbi:MAG: hypothetical protein R2751_01250 [Bacteroidales bacterium]
MLNVAVELNGQLPLQVYARPLVEPKIVLRSIDQGQMLEVTRFEDLLAYRQVGGSFSIPWPPWSWPGSDPPSPGVAPRPGLPAPGIRGRTGNVLSGGHSQRVRIGH